MLLVPLSQLQKCTTFYLIIFLLSEKINYNLIIESWNCFYKYKYFLDCQLGNKLPRSVTGRVIF